jgi:hypothetical protein
MGNWGGIAEDLEEFGGKIPFNSSFIFPTESNAEETQTWHHPHIWSKIVWIVEVKQCSLRVKSFKSD